MLTKLTITDWVAIVGAGAWVPHLVTWINDFFAKPTLALFPAAAPEVGFSAYGTVLNLQCAISASVTDAVIERMEVELLHERGQRTVLPWRGIHETLGEIQSSTGETEIHKRQQSALALKVLTEELSEKVVMFQDADFQNRLSDHVRALEVRSDRIASQEPPESRSALVLKSDEFALAATDVRSAMAWQAGSYDIVFRLKAAERSRPFEFRYRFQLSQTDVDRLRDNIDFVIDLVTQAAAPDHPAPNKSWNWRYPAMTKRD